MSYYFHKNWTIDTTPGGVKLPTVAVFLLVPILGALFLMFLPLIGFLLAIQAAALKVKSLALDLLSASTTPVAIGEAHFTGKPTDPLDEMEKEIENRRK